MNHPTRLGTDKPASVPAISRFVSIPMRVNAGDSIPISRKEMQAPRACVCKERERRKKEKLRGKKVFVEILGMGEWAPLFLVLSSPTPLSISPRGFHVEHAWHGRSLIGGMMAGKHCRQGHTAGPQGINWDLQGRHNRPQGRPSMAPRQAQELPDRPVGLLKGDGRSEWANGGPTHFRGFK